MGKNLTDLSYDELIVLRNSLGEYAISLRMEDGKAFSETVLLTGDFSERRKNTYRIAMSLKTVVERHISNCQ